VVAKIKFCGMMRSQDAAAAVEAGAAYLGVVFAEGARAVSEDGAREVAAAAGVPVLGVFVKQTPDQILRTAAACGIRGVQLHGLYSRGEAAWLRAEGLEVWQVVRIGKAWDLDALAGAGADADAVLVEPLVPHVRGGAGIPLDLELARQARHRLVGQMVLAGGLRPDNVGAAIAAVHPQVVDVSSGVECRPGIKDPNQIARFVEAVLAYSSVT